MSQTILRRVRSGSGVPLRQAARRAGVPYPRLSNWETGERTPPPGMVEQVIEAVAMGAPRPGDHVLYLVGYDMSFGGQRWLIDDEGRVVVLVSPAVAMAAADVLERDQFPSLKIVPCWPGAIEMIAPDRRRRVAFDGTPEEAAEIAEACSSRWLRLFTEGDAELGLA